MYSFYYYGYLHKEKIFRQTDKLEDRLKKTEMDRTIIAKRAFAMQNKEDLLALLNHVKKAELEEIGLQDSFRPFTMRHLNFYCNPNHVFHRYRQFKIKKKSGGYRQITAPRSQSFMMMLQATNEILKAVYTPSDYAMGFTEGRSVVTNASVHKGQNYILNLDLKDFFPSIEQRRVWNRLQTKPYNMPQQIASLIAGLCSMRVMREIPDKAKEKQNDQVYIYVLPQGAPTSPIITNMICDTLDRRLAGLARRFGLHYTRYADDITFSSMHYVYSKNGVFWKELVRIITDQGFTINDAKTRLQKRGSRQEVTGIIVSDKLNVTKKYVHDIRNILYIWEKYGVTAAMATFLPKYKEEKGHVKKGNLDFINVIDGKLMYLKMVKGEEDSVYVRLNNKFQELVEKVHDVRNTNEHQVTYVETTPVLEFEKKNNTEIIITWSKPSIKTEQDKKNPDQQIVISLPAHRFAWFIFAGKRTKASVNKSITPEEEKAKDLLAISLCRDAKDKQFWLIHRLNKVTVPLSRAIDIDELNNDLNSLINIEDG